MKTRPWLIGVAIAGLGVLILLGPELAARLGAVAGGIDWAGALVAVGLFAAAFLLGRWLRGRRSRP